MKVRCDAQVCIHARNCAKSLPTVFMAIGNIGRKCSILFTLI